MATTLDSCTFGPVQDQDGRTALHTCVQRAHSHRAFALLALVGPDMLSIKDKQGKTCLDLAVDHFEMAKQRGVATLGQRWHEATLDAEKAEVGPTIANTKST